MLHLYLFESLLEQHGICYGYKVGPRMMSIQVGYNKNYHRKVNWMLWSIWCLIIVLRYGGSDIRVMLVEVIMKNTCVKGCDSRSMHVWWTALWWSWSTILFIDCLPYEWRSGTSDGLFLPIYPPRSMHVVLCFWWLVDFCNKYMSSFD